MTNRDELAALIRPSLQQSDDEGWTVDTLAQALEIADDILAAGWVRQPRTFKHARESTPTIDYTHTTDPRGWAGQ